MPTYGPGTQFFLQPALNVSPTASGGGNTAMDADTEAVAIKIYPQSTSPVSSVDIQVSVTGSLSGINFKLWLESDSNDAPSGTKLGATNNALTSEFTISASGFVGLQALAETSGNLTVNTPIWLVLQRTSGNSLSASNYLALYGSGNSGVFPGNHVRHRHHNGTNWTTTAAVNQRASYVLLHSDGSYTGCPYTAVNVSPSAATDIYGNYRHGLRLKFGCQVLIPGIDLYIVKSGSPNALVVSVYSGATLKYSNTVPAATVISTVSLPVYFSSPELLPADTFIYITLKQESDGGTDSADYTSRVSKFSSTYREAAMPAEYAFVYGTGDDPTAYTVSNTDSPCMAPFICSLATHFDQAAGGGGFPILGGSVVR